MGNNFSTLDLTINIDRAEITNQFGSSLYKNTETIRVGSQYLVRCTILHDDGTPFAIEDTPATGFFFGLADGFRGNKLTHQLQFNIGQWAEEDLSQGKIAFVLDANDFDILALIEGESEITTYGAIWGNVNYLGWFLIAQFPLIITNVIAYMYEDPVDGDQSSESSSSSSSSSEGTSSSSSFDSSSSSSSEGTSSSSSSSSEEYSSSSSSSSSGP